MAQEEGHRWFAAFYDRINRSMERRVLGGIRRDLLGGLTGEVIEVGAGTGANFSYYPDGVRVSAFEPDPHMIERATKRLAGLGRTNVELRQAPAERLPVPDGSCDAVVSTLVLCTVPDVRAALAEIGRVLRPGGQLGFIEHVRNEGAVGRVQDLIVPVWCWCAAGCHPNRRTGEAIRQAGFEVARLGQHSFSGFRGISGIARQASSP